MASRQITVRLHPDKLGLVEAEAKVLGCSHGEVIRRAVDHYLDRQKTLDESDIRLRRVCEFAHLALDVIIKEEHPDLRDTILTETDNRVRRYHAAR